MRDAERGWGRVLVGRLLAVVAVAMGAMPTHADEQGVVRLETDPPRAQALL